ncbi:MAG: hypothetical protein AABW56_04315 [Nanoarchaeota archaeon]
MILQVKKGRVWIPKKKQTKYKGKFIEIFVKNNNKKSSFIAVIPKDGRFYIPIEIRNKLKVKDKIKIEKIILLKNKRRNDKLISKNRFNILSIIPEKTLSDYEILVVDMGDKYLCWYCTQGRPKEILLNKHVPLSFAKLLGYYQAEGGKPKLRKRTGRNFSFTNKKFELIKDFFNISKCLFDVKEWNVTIRYEKNMDYKKIEELKDKLKFLGINPKKIFIRQAKRIKESTIVLWISNSVLTEVIDNFNKKFKEFIIKEKNEFLFKNYFQGEIAGDGNFFSYRDKTGSLHSRLNIYEEKLEYVLNHKRILDNFGLIGKIKKDKEKELYTLKLTNNWEMLLRLLEYDLFYNAPHHKKRLIWTIKEHNRFRALNYIINLPIKFNSKILNKTLGDRGTYIYSWLRKRRKEGLIKTLDKGLWSLTEEGIKIKNLLNKTI